MKKLFFGFIFFLLSVGVVYVAEVQSAYQGPSKIKTEKEFYQWARSFINDAYEKLFSQTTIYSLSSSSGTIKITNEYLSTAGNPGASVQTSVGDIRDNYNEGGTGQDDIENVQAKFKPMEGHLDTIESNINTEKTKHSLQVKNYANSELLPYLYNLKYRLANILDYIQRDDDGDGVLNNDDKCPLTDVASDDFVDKNGCNCAQKNCEQFEGFECQRAFVKELDASGQAVVKHRAVCVEIKDETPYDLREAIRDSQMVNHGDRRFIAVYPQHLVGADDKSLQGDASDITVFFQRFANGLTILAGSLAVAFIVINGFTMVVAAGNEEQIKTAKKGLLWSVLALLLIIMAYVIVKTVLSISYSGQEFEKGIDQTTGQKASQTTPLQQNIDERNEDIENLKQEKADLEKQKEDLRKEAEDKGCTDTLLQGFTGSQECEDIQDEIDQIDDEIEEKEDAIEDLEDQNEDDQDDLDDINEQYNKY